MSKVIISLIFLICIFSLFSCEAITAQNIDINNMNNNGFQGRGQQNGGFQGRDPQNNGFQRNMNSSFNESMKPFDRGTNPNYVGKIVSFDKTKIELNLFNFSDVKSNKSFSDEYLNNSTKVFELKNSIQYILITSKVRNKSSVSYPSLKENDIVYIWCKENEENILKIGLYRD